MLFELFLILQFVFESSRSQIWLNVVWLLSVFTRWQYIAVDCVETQSPKYRI